MIDIYFGAKRLTIAAESTNGYEVTPNSSCGIDRHELQRLFERHAWVTLRTENEEHTTLIYELFARQFTPIVAAGGAVRSDTGEILMIHRNGRWDLPKGHWEEGESIEECAIREVMEESGVQDIYIIRPLCTTLHSYYLYGRWELKSTHWYLMQGDSSQTLTPQEEEGIDRAAWLNEEEVAEAMKGSFPNIRRVLESI